MAENEKEQKEELKEEKQQNKIMMNQTIDLKEFQQNLKTLKREATKKEKDYIILYFQM